MESVACIRSRKASPLDRSARRQTLSASALNRPEPDILGVCYGPQNGKVQRQVCASKADIGRLDKSRRRVEQRRCVGLCMTACHRWTGHAEAGEAFAWRSFSVTVRPPPGPVLLMAQARLRRAKSNRSTMLPGSRAATATTLFIGSRGGVVGSRPAGLQAIGCVR